MAIKVMSKLSVGKAHPCPASRCFCARSRTIQPETGVPDAPTVLTHPQPKIPSAHLYSILFQSPRFEPPQPPKMKLPPRIAWTIFTLLCFATHAFANDMVQVTKCEGETAKLSCPDGLVIDIALANYGRFSVNPCNPDGLTNLSTACLNKDTLDIVKERCDNRTECDINVSVSLFGDACPNTPKYLEVNYACVKPAPTTTTSTTTTARPTTPEIPVNSIKPAPFSHRGDVPPTPDSAEDAESKRKTTTSPKPVFCEAGPRRFVHWPKTEGGRMARVPCPSGMNGFAEWRCGKNGFWRPASGPDLSGCMSSWSIKHLDNVKTDRSDAVTQREALKFVHSQSQREQLVGGDLLNVDKILKEVTLNMQKIAEETPASLESHERDVEMARLTVEIANHLLSSNNAGGWIDLQDTPKRRHAASSLLLTVERALATTVSRKKSSASTSTSTKIVAQPFISSEVSSVALSPYVAFPGAPYNKDEVIVPREALQVSGDVTADVVYANIDGLPIFLNPSNATRGVTQIVASRIVTLSIVANGKIHEVEHLADPVVIKFKHLNQSDELSNPTCASWDPIEHEWTTNGSRLKSANKTQVICEYTHLSHFAVLMDVHGIKPSAWHVDNLRLLTQVCCVFSILCLLATFLVYAIVSNMMIDRNFIHVNFTGVYWVAMVIFLFGIDRTMDWYCSTIAIVLHYLFLCVFSWSLLEGVMLYDMIKTVFNTKHYGKTLLCVIGYGIPALIVGAAFIYKPNGYGTVDHCWLTTDDYFNWAFAGPVFIVVFINICFLFMTLSAVLNRYRLCNVDDSNTFSKKWILGSLGLLFLLGITWGLGFFWFGNGNIYVAYAFVILNGLQGAGVFLFHVVLNARIKEEFTNFLRRNDALPFCCRSCVLSPMDRSGPFTPSGNSSGTESQRNSSPSQTPPRKGYINEYDLANNKYDEQEPFLRDDVYASPYRHPRMFTFNGNYAEPPMSGYYAAPPCYGRSVTLGRPSSSRLPEYPAVRQQPPPVAVYPNHTFHPVAPSVHNNQPEGEYYATIPYDDLPHYQRYLQDQAYTHPDYYRQAALMEHWQNTGIRPPPQFRPPPPPSNGITSLPLSDDSAYSDSCASMRPTPERSPNARTTSRLVMDFDRPNGIAVQHL
uniref:Latrophilin Cirl n=1 Tax=Panagrellus redivivus TaxID=6233 RepID=A0A7E4ULD6_PANRE